MITLRLQTENVLSHVSSSFVYRICKIPKSNKYREFFMNGSFDSLKRKITGETESIIVYEMHQDVQNFLIRWQVLKKQNDGLIKSVDNWIQSFPSLRPVVLSRLESPVYIWL